MSTASPVAPCSLRTGRGAADTLAQPPLSLWVQSQESAGGMVHKALLSQAKSQQESQDTRPTLNLLCGCGCKSQAESLQGP